MTASSKRRTSKKSSIRRRLRAWLPGQPGAVMMAMTPALGGDIASVAYDGFSAAPWWLTACWMLCYCVQFSAARWFKSRGSRRWLRQPLVYCAILCAVGIPFIAVHPDILAWAPTMVILAVASFAASWLRKERSLWSNAVAVAAACLMALLTFRYGCDLDIVRKLGNTGIVIPDLGIRDLTVPGVDGSGSLLACAFAIAQFGSVLFVKTMIRERGNTKYLAASWAWHAVAVAIASAVHMPMLTVLSALLLIRAVVMPLLAKHRTVRPLHTGLVEFASSIASCALIVGTAV
ncbi:YwiC-like family protein [Bifidobacterium sp. 64T4]|uniref:YwiC-like family protein n=1 Tax=Bifidobacterium pongonis TaxID=2834432 RepID=UPI001C588118|nr:YwiC-like family protein [Bifidobacterium pongonis]MBW3093822.1 YwiC-like family protein [Bifidobacterium pongonis]MBW3093889.1 YwiC-like family protein [Bifidobacterium pongonis]